MSVKKGPWQNNPEKTEYKEMSFLLSYFPKMSEEFALWSYEKVKDTAFRAQAIAYRTGEEIEDVFKYHSEFMNEQYKKDNSKALVAELEHVIEMAKVLHTGDSIDALYSKLMKEAAREAIEQELFNT